MPDRNDFWYRLGYALESARHGQARASLDALSSSPPPRREKDERSGLRKPGADDEGSGALDLLLAAGTGTLLSRLLRAWPARRRAGASRLVRAAAAGAAATFLRELLAPLLEGRPALPEWDEAMADRLLAGAARGLVYGGILDPRLPGPAAARGAAYGTAEYLLSPWGGLRGLLRRHTPYRRLPVISSLLDEPEVGEEEFLEHLVFGVAMGLLYGEGDDVRIGIVVDEE